jgi:hypothetical protein
MNASEMRIKVEEATVRRLAEEELCRVRQLVLFEERVACLTSDALDKMSKKLEFPYAYYPPRTMIHFDFRRCTERVELNLRHKGYETEYVAGNYWNDWRGHIIIRLPGSLPAKSSRINPVAAPNHSPASLPDAPPSYQEKDKPPEYSDATNPRKCCYL